MLKVCQGLLLERGLYWAPCSKGGKIKLHYGGLLLYGFEPPQAHVTHK